LERSPKSPLDEVQFSEKKCVGAADIIVEEMDGVDENVLTEDGDNVIPIEGEYDAEGNEEGCTGLTVGDRVH
jgi:hypothetical protein